MGRRQGRLWSVPSPCTISSQLALQSLTSAEPGNVEWRIYRRQSPCFWSVVVVFSFWHWYMSLLWLSKMLCQGRHFIVGCSVYFQRPPVRTSLSHYFPRQWTHCLLTSYNSFQYAACQGISLGMLCSIRQSSWMRSSHASKHGLNFPGSTWELGSLDPPILKVQLISILPSDDAPTGTSPSYLPTF